jgi:hypothetical protein
MTKALNPDLHVLVCYGLFHAEVKFEGSFRLLIAVIFPHSNNDEILSNIRA